MAFIEVDNLQCQIDGTEILKGISFGVERGDFLSIIGPNGAGKTTLLKCLNRIICDWHGRIGVDGRMLTELSQREIAKVFGYVPQLQAQVPGFRVRDFLLMSRYPHLSPLSAPGLADFASVHEALEVTGTGPFADRQLGTLSGGERQKVFIAAALVQDAPVLLLDEPTTFLDPRYQSEVNRLLRERNAAGVTVVVVSHDLNSSVRLSSRILALKHGLVVFAGAPAGLMEPEVLGTIFETGFVHVNHPQDGTPQVLPA
jgi:iron complex transport system ATP-binding protein